MLYILSEITFQFYFFRYKIILYVYIYIHNWVLCYGFKFFTPTFYWNCFLHIVIPPSTLRVLAPLPFPTCHLLFHAAGKVPNYIQSPPGKITLKIFTLLDKNNLTHLKISKVDVQKLFQMVDFLGISKGSQFLIFLSFLIWFDWGHTYSSIIIEGLCFCLILSAILHWFFTVCLSKIWYEKVQHIKQFEYFLWNQEVFDISGCFPF